MQFWLLRVQLFPNYTQMCAITYTNEVGTQAIKATESRYMNDGITTQSCGKYYLSLLWHGFMTCQCRGLCCNTIIHISGDYENPDRTGPKVNSPGKQD